MFQDPLNKNKNNVKPVRLNKTPFTYTNKWLWILKLRQIWEIDIKNSITGRRQPIQEADTNMYNHLLYTLFISKEETTNCKKIFVALCGVVTRVLATPQNDFFRKGSQVASCMSYKYGTLNIPISMKEIL